MIDMECLICGEGVKTRDVKVAVAFDCEHTERLAAAKAAREDTTASRDDVGRD